MCVNWIAPHALTLWPVSPRVSFIFFSDSCRATGQPYLRQGSRHYHYLAINTVAGLAQRGTGKCMRRMHRCAMMQRSFHVFMHWCHKVVLRSAMRNAAETHVDVVRVDVPTAIGLRSNPDARASHGAYVEIPVLQTDLGRIFFVFSRFFLVHRSGFGFDFLNFRLALPSRPLGIRGHVLLLFSGLRKRPISAIDLARDELRNRAGYANISAGTHNERFGRLRNF